MQIYVRGGPRRSRGSPGSGPAENRQKTCPINPGRSFLLGPPCSLGGSKFLRILNPRILSPRLFCFLPGPLQPWVGTVPRHRGVLYSFGGGGPVWRVLPVSVSKPSERRFEKLLGVGRHWAREFRPDPAKNLRKIRSRISRGIPGAGFGQKSKKNPGSAISGDLGCRIRPKIQEKSGLSDIGGSRGPGFGTNPGKIWIRPKIHENQKTS